MFIDNDRAQNFRDKFNAHYPDAQMTTDEAAAAIRNLAGFINLLLTINNREGIVDLGED